MVEAPGPCLLRAIHPCLGTSLAVLFGLRGTEGAGLIVLGLRMAKADAGVMQCPCRLLSSQLIRCSAWLSTARVAAT